MNSQSAALKSGYSERLRGILFLILAVAFFGMVDGLSKLLIETQSFGQVMLARNFLALPLLIAFTPPAGWPALFQTKRPGLQVLRGLAPVGIGGSMVFAVKYLPLAEATVILFAGPFFVVALSGWLLGEKVKLSSWIGVAIGFLAVLVVARPGFNEMSHYAIFPAVAAVFYGLFQLLSRRLGAAGENPTVTLAWTLLIGNLVAAPFAIADWQPLTGEGWALILLLGLTFGIGQYFMARAFAMAPANVLTPFSYFQILSALVFGVLVFADFPDLWTLVGMVMILGAGLYVFGQNRSPSETP